jgi:Putative transmembrane protein (PGPGW)
VGSGGKRRVLSPRRLGVIVVGWILVLAGIAALILPGPGLLLLLFGLVVLSQEHEWAARRVEPVKEKAFGVASAGVETVPRIVASTFGAVALIAVGVVWAVDPRIPTVWKLGPRLPFGGWAVASSLMLSGLVALGLLVYSIRRFRGQDATSGSGVSRN